MDADMLLEPPIVSKDLIKAVKRVRPTVSQEDTKGVRNGQHSLEAKVPEEAHTYQ